MSNVCDLSVNQALKESLEQYVNGIIAYKFANEPTFSYKDVTFEIFKSVYEAKGDKAQALGIAYHVPQLVYDIINTDKSFDAVKLASKGYDPSSLLKDLALLRESEDKITSIADTIGVLDMSIEELKTLILETPTDETLVVLSISDRPDIQAIDKKLSSLSFFNSTGSVAEEAGDIDIKMLEKTSRDSYKLYYDNFKRELLSRQKEEDPDFSNVTFGGHTGFKGVLMFENQIPGQKSPERTKLLDKAILTMVLTDNNGNILYFKDDMTVGDINTGRPIYSVLKSTVKQDEEGNIVNEKIIKNAIEKRAFLTAMTEEELAEALKKIDDEMAFINKAKEDAKNNIFTPVNIVGGSKGSITPTQNLSATLRAEVEFPLSRFTGLTDKEKNSINFANMKVNRDVTVQVPVIKFEDYDYPIILKSTNTIGVADPDLLKHIVDVLVDDIQIGTETLSSKDKVDYARQFINTNEEAKDKNTLPYKILSNKNTKELTVILNNNIVSLKDKEAAKKTIMEFLGKNAYIHFHKESYDKKFYYKYALELVDNKYIGTKSDINYYPFISEKLTPRIALNKRTNRPMVLNSYLSFSPIVTNEEIDAKIKDTTNDLKGIPDNTEDAFLGMARSKLIETITNAEQEERVQNWWKSSGLSKALDSDGKPLFNLNLLRNVVNSDAWATFSGSTITLYAGSSFTHVYHEAWHAFSQVYLTKPERTKIYDALSKLPGSFEVVRKIALPGGTNYEKVSVNFADATREELEEFVAEEFRIYAMNNGKFNVKGAKTNIFKKIFDRVWKALTTLLTGVKPVTLYSNPNTGNVMSEMFNVLYTAKKPEDLLPYKPNIANAEFGLLNSGIVNKKGEQVLSLSELILLSKSMDGIMSKYITEKVQDSRTKAFAATKLIFNSPKALEQIYYFVKKEFNDKRIALEKELNSLGEGNDQEKVILQNKIRVLSEALKGDIFGNVLDIADGKDFSSTIVAFHRENSAFKDMFGKLKIEGSEVIELDEKDIEDVLAGKFDVPSNGNKSEDLASNFVKYLVSSLLKVDKDGKIKPNELGFPETIDFGTFWRILMDKASGETSILGLYNKLKDATAISPLFQQLLDKIYVQETAQDGVTLLSPSESLAMMFEKGDNISEIWLDLLQATNLHKIDLVAVQLDENTNGEYDVKVGKTSSSYQNVIRNWESAFQQQPDSSYIGKTNDQVNYLKLNNIFNDFIIESIGIKNEPVYNVGIKNYADFLNAIGIFVSPNEDLVSSLTSNDVDYLATAVAKIYKYNRNAYEYNKNLPEGREKRKTVLITNPIREFALGMNLPDGTKISHNAFVINKLAGLEAEYSEEFSTGMRPTPGGGLKSIYALNSSDTQKIKALQKANRINDLYSSDPELMHMNYLNPKNNPKAGGLVLMNSLFANNETGDKIKNNNVNFYDLTGTSYTNTEGLTRGVAYAKMSPIDKILTSILGTLGGGFMEGITPGDKSSYFSVKTDYIKTYTAKEIDYLYVDTHAFIKDSDGNYIKGYNPMNKALEIMYPKLEGEIRAIKMLADNPEYENYEGFKRSKDFDIFDEILDSDKNPKLKSELKSAEFFAKLQKAGSLIALLARDKALKDQIDQEIVEYFEKLAERQDKNLFSEAFGVDTPLPKTIENLVTSRLSKEEKAELVSENDANNNDYNRRIREAALMSYTVNNFIHKTEVTVLLQGDGSQFDHDKDESTKRTPGSQSSGRIFPVDRLAQLIANKFGRPYEKKLLDEGKLTKREGVTPGIRSYNGILNTAVLEESVVRSEYFDMYRDLFKKDFESKGLKGDALNKALYGFDSQTGEIGNENNVYDGGKMKPYTEIKDADGQAWITFDTYRLLKRLESAWSKEQEAAYMKIVNGEVISPLEATELFPVYKLQENGPLATNKYPVMSFHKFSLFPLIPSVIKGKPLEKLHQAMLEQNTDYVLLKSGSKRSFIKSSPKSKGDLVFNGDSSNIKDPSEITFTNNPIYVAYLKNQTNVNSYFKDESTFSTQMRKLLFGNLFMLGTPVDFLSKYDNEVSGRNAWNSLSYSEKIKQSPIYDKSERFIKRLDEYVGLQKQLLLKDLEFITEQGEEQDETKKMIAMIKFLTKELKDQGFSDHELSILQASSNVKDVDLSLSPLASRFEKLVVAVVNNRLVRLKIKGEPFVEVSSVFFQSGTKPVKFKKPTEEQKKQYDNFGTNGLRSYVPDLSGKTATKGFGFKRAFTRSDMGLLNTNYYSKNDKGEYVLNGTVAVYDTVKDENGKDKKTLNFEASFERLNEMLQVDQWLTDDNNYKKIRLTGVRIPVQGDNSIEFGQVAEFLRPDAGPIIVIPAEIVAKSGTDFDVDKMTAYLPYVTRNGKLLEPLTEEEVDKKIEAATKKLDKLKETKTDIEFFKEARGTAWKSLRNNFNEFRNAIERGANLIPVDKAMYKALTNKNNKELHDILQKEETQDFLKSNFKRAYNIYEKTIKPVSSIELASIEAAIDELYSEKSELSSVFKEFEDLNEHKQNIVGGVQNGFIDDIIDIMSLPEKAVSLLSPNDTNIVKPFADELKDYIQNADNETDYTKSLKTGKKLHAKGISSTNIYTEDYNLKRQQENISGKGALGIAAVDNYINVLLNMAGGKMNQSIQVKVNEYDEATESYKKVVKSMPISLKLSNNSVDGAISLSHMFDVNDIHSIADVISQLMNGFVDVGKDAWVNYLNANLDVVPKILFLIEAGVPISDVAYFVNNPLIRQYVKENKKAKAVMAPFIFGPLHNPSTYRRDLIEKMLSSLKKDKNAQKNLISEDPIENMYAYSELLKTYGKDKYFDTSTLKTIAQSKADPTSKAQLSGLLQYLYLENMISDYDTMKRVFNPDTNTSNDLLAAKLKITDVASIENAPSLDKNIHNHITKESVISPFFVQDFTKKLFGRIFGLRTNDVVEDFLVNDIGTDKIQKAVIKRGTGFDFETFSNKFRNFIAQYIFVNELGNYDSKSKVYKGYEISDEFLAQVNEDFNTGRFLTTSTDPNSYKNRGLAPINPRAFPIVRNQENVVDVQKSEKYRENFIEFSLEREYLRQETTEYDDNYNPIGIKESLLNSKEFKLRKSRLMKLGSELYAKRKGESAEAYNSRMDKVTYEDYLANQALKNTYNIWQLFRSGDNTIARELMDIIENYKEIGQNTEFSILQQFIPDSIINDRRYKGVVNFKLRNWDTLDEGLISEYNQQWASLANINDPKKLSIIKDPAANAYISDFFSKLPIYAFLQSGMDPSQFSLASTMPYNLYLPIMQMGKETFVKKMEGKDAKRILRGMYTLFTNQNAISNKGLANRGLMYNVKYENLSLNEYSLSEQPFLTLQPNGIYIMELNYVKNGISYKVDKDLIDNIKASNPSVRFLTSLNDILSLTRGTKPLITREQFEDIRNDINLAFSILSDTGYDIVVYPEGFLPDGIKIEKSSSESEKRKNQSLGIKDLKEEEPTSTTISDKVIEGDIFALPGIPVITTNLEGVHGAGLAQKAKAKGLIKQGDGAFKETDKVVQLPVKGRMPSTRRAGAGAYSESVTGENIELLKEGLRSLIRIAKAKPSNTYLLPLAGLGHGEGSIEDILPLLIKTVQASPNIRLVLPVENVNLGRQGTVRKDYTRENMPKIKAMLTEAGLMGIQPSTPSVQTRTFKNEEYHQAYLKGGLAAVQELIEKNKQKEISAAKQLSKEVDMLTEFENLNSKTNKTNSENDKLIELYVMLKNSKQLDFEYSLNQLGLSTQPAVSNEVKGTIQLELIENLVQTGKAKTTVRKYDKPSGIYKSQSGNLYNLVNRGKVRMVGDKIIGKGIAYTLDEFGAAEGFDNWANFVKNAKYAGVDIQMGKEVYLYDITPANRTATAPAQDRVIKVDQYNITVKPDGTMLFQNGNEVKDQVVKNKVNIRKEFQDGTLRISLYNNNKYFVLSDNRIMGSGQTNLGKETIKNESVREEILKKATVYKKQC